MLQLRDIRKNYVTASETVEALKGVDLSFRQNAPTEWADTGYEVGMAQFVHEVKSDCECKGTKPKVKRVNALMP